MNQEELENCEVGLVGAGLDGRFNPTSKTHMIKVKLEKEKIRKNMCQCAVEPISMVSKKKCLRQTEAYLLHDQQGRALSGVNAQLECYTDKSWNNTIIHGAAKKRF